MRIRYRYHVTRAVWRVVAGFTAAAIGSIAPLQTALAQVASTSQVSGRVTDSRSKLPVPAVTIQVVGTAFGTQTDQDGRFRMSGLSAGKVVLATRRIGYAVKSKEVTLGAQPVVVDYELDPAATTLDEVVVTGTAGGELRRQIGNSVSTINADDAMSKSGAQSVSSLIGARAAGVIIAPSTGRLGAGPSIQVRGRSSIGLDNSPLLYVDGVRVNNATASGAVAPAGKLGGQGSNVGGRLNDIAPEDIESIEIIKGPAAATIYGTEAANGVIQIITKRGSAGNKPQLALNVEEGTISFRNAVDRIPTNYLKDAAGAIVPWNGYQTEKDRGTPIFQTGQTRKYNGSLSGGQQGLTYFVSGGYQNDLGIEPNNALRQGSFRANLSIHPSANTDVSTSLGYVWLTSHLGADFGVSPLLGAAVGHSIRYTASRGFYPYSPEVPQGLYDNSQSVRRFVGSTTITNKPTSWLTQRLIAGVDETFDDSRALERFTSDPLLVAQLGAVTAGGSIGQTIRHNTIVSTEYSLTATQKVTESLKATSSLGGQFYRTELNSNFLGGTGFPGQGVETVSAASTPVSATQAQLLNTTIGAYGQQQLGWRDKLFVTAAVRVDNNSAFGDKLKWVTYPKASLSWVASEEGFWRENAIVNSLRLRSAYGQSGRQPTSFSALRTFSPTQGPGGSSAVTPNSIGNVNLKPERGSEVELGFETQLLHRLSLDFTYWSRQTRDVIINQPVAPSSGFAVATPRNLGRVDNDGIEAVATLQAVQRKRVTWELVANIGTNGDVIKDLGGVGGVAVSAGQTNVVGYPIGGIFTRRVVSADRDATTGAATSVLCDGGAGKAPVACASAPFVFIGTPTPKLNGAVSSTLTLFNNVRLYGLMDFKRGNRLQNSNELLRCTGATGALLCRANYYPGEFAPVYLAERVTTASALGITDQYYQNASFVKLRELSLSYTIPASLARGYRFASITVTGRDLALWTKYAGIDPEVNNNNIATSSAISDQAAMPPLSRFLVTLNLRF